MGSLSPSHWLIIALLVVILFGAKKLPDAARGLGRSLRIFKTEVKEMHSDEAASPDASATPQQPAQQLPPAQPAADPAQTAPNPDLHKA